MGVVKDRLLAKKKINKLLRNIIAFYEVVYINEEECRTQHNLHFQDYIPKFFEFKNYTFITKFFNKKLIDVVFFNERIDYNTFYFHVCIYEYEEQYYQTMFGTTVRNLIKIKTTNFHFIENIKNN